MIILLVNFSKEIIELDNPKEEYQGDDFVIISYDGAQELGQILSVDDRPAPQRDSEHEIQILRLATTNDQHKIEHGQKAARDLIAKAQKAVEELKLPMHIWDAAFSFDEKRVTFFFQAAERVDFRELVRNLSADLKKKVHLQQVGPRDRAKLRDGFGICGQRLCCANFLRSFPSVTMETARVQNLGYKSPDKISGQCGRLLCCLNYEAETYRDLGAEFPALGEIVKFAGGEKRGRVISNDIIGNQVKVQVEGDGQDFVVAVPRDEIIGKYKTVGGSSAKSKSAPRKEAEVSRE